jgi:hypothetical protein
MHHPGAQTCRGNAESHPSLSCSATRLRQGFYAKASPGARFVGRRSFSEGRSAQAPPPLEYWIARSSRAMTPSELFDMCI